MVVVVVVVNGCLTSLFGTNGHLSGNKYVQSIVEINDVDIRVG